MIDEKTLAEPKAPNRELGNSAPKITRRRFTKAGAMAPVIMTLGSRPVWGQTCSFSGQLSGNDYSTSAPTGAGQPPSYWYDLDKDSWPIVGTRFDKQGAAVDIRVDKGDEIWPYVEQFASCNPFGTATFNDLFKGKSSDSDVAAHAAAAVLNVLEGNYGYGMDGVMSFLCSAAMAHPDEVLAILQALNSNPRSC